MTTANQHAPRLDYIDALRGWAILLVMFAHCAAMTRIGGWLRTFADACMMGIYLFFVISAFTIFHMYDKHRRTERHPVRNFFIRRFFRIAPLYWFAIVLYNIIWGWLPAHQAWHYYLNFFFLHALNPEPHTSVVPGGWSISLEVLFYLCVPVLFVLLKSFARAAIFTLICVVFFPLAASLLSQLAAPVFKDVMPYLVAVYWERFPLITIGSFSFGILLYYLQREDRVMSLVRQRNVDQISLMLIGVGFVVFAYVRFNYPHMTHVYSFLFMVLALLLSAHPWKVLVNPATVALGRISYSMYVFHFAVTSWLSLRVQEHFAQWTGLGYVYFALFVVIATAVTIPLACCGYMLIEKPAIRCSIWLVERFERSARKG